MGEESFAPSQTNQACQEAMEQSGQEAQESLRVKTPGGVYDVQWNTQGKASAMGQLAFFAEFLETNGLFVATTYATLNGFRPGFRAQSARPPLKNVGTLLR